MNDRDVISDLYNDSNYYLYQIFFGWYIRVPLVDYLNIDFNNLFNYKNSNKRNDRYYNINTEYLIRIFFNVSWIKVYEMTDRIKQNRINKIEEVLLNSTNDFALKMFELQINKNFKSAY
jgi:hypothetical protein